MKEPLFSSSDRLNLQQERADKLAEVGAKLRQTRLEKSISLEQLAVKTMIRSHLLEAIEEGNLESLPEDIYIQRLIERYANAIELDGKKLASLFPTKAEEKPLEKEKVYVRVSKLKAHHLYFAYICVVVLSIFSLSKASLVSISSNENSSNSKLATSGETDPQGSNNSGGGARLVGAPSNNSSQQSGNNSLENTYQSQNQNKPVRVSVIVQEDSWVSVEIDGKIEFEGILPRGTEKTWQAQEKLVFLAGNAGGVLVAFNNGQAKQLGAPGAVEELVWDVDNPNYPGSQQFQN